MIEDFSIKMDDPKEPDARRTWQAMDIYIFGNGQQNSPPRKYHLEADQLQWWPVTLNYLACTQYGSIDREIDLFTIDGTKIQDPLELKNEHAYVAVQKPDQFLDSGYSKYLVKATKSWEKSQSKRANNNNNNNNDTIAHRKDDVTPEIRPEDSDVKFFQIVEPAPDNSTLLHTIVQRQSVNRSSSAIKIPPESVEKKKESDKITDSKRSSIQTPLQRLSSQSTSSSIRKQLIKKKESVKLGNTLITRPANDKKGPTRNPSNLKPLEGIIVSKSKLYKGSNMKCGNLLTELPKVYEDLNEKNTSSDKHCLKPNNKNYIISSNVIPINTIQVDVLDPIPLEIEHPKLPDVISLKNDEIEAIKENVTEIHKDNKSFRIDSTTRISDKETVRLSGNISAVLNKENKEILQNLDTTDKSYEDKGLTATDKNDDVVKFQIDIWYHNKDPTQTMIAPNCPQIAISKDKDSNIPDETICKRCAGTSIDVNIDDQSYVFIKCFSRFFNEESLNSENCCKKSNNKGFIIFVPMKHIDESKVCHCLDELGSKGRQVRQSTLVFPVRRTTSCLSLLQTTSYLGSGHGLLGDTNLIHMKQPRVSRDRCTIVGKKKSNIMIKDYNYGRILYTPSIVNEPTSTDFVLIEPATINVLSVKTVEESTQTEWCNLMMEARLQSDGHYALCLPSLETLKKYKLHVC